MSQLTTYLESLPLVKTATLPKGRLFYANNLLYEVIAVDSAGYSRARGWRKDENTDVALIPQSSLARRLPVIDQARVLPLLSRHDLLQNNQPISYIFPSEANAIDAAYLDSALCGQVGALYVRRHERFPAFEVTNGMTVMRRYYYMRSRAGVDVGMQRLKSRISESLVPHKQGAIYWQMLDTWDDSPYYDATATLVMRPVDLERFRAETAQHKITPDEPSEAERTLIRRPKKDKGDTPE